MLNIIKLDFWYDAHEFKDVLDVIMLFLFMIDFIPLFILDEFREIVVQNFKTCPTWLLFLANLRFSPVQFSVKIHTRKGVLT